MKRKCFAAAVLVVLAALMTFGTLAYFTAERRTENIITTGSIDLELTNQLSGQTHDGTVITFMPGDRVENTVTVKNAGDHPAFVRVALNVTVNDSSLNPDGCVSVNIDTEHWIYADGYYYYRGTVGAEETVLLFDEVAFDGRAMDNAWLGKTVSLEVDLYGVQSENNGTDPLTAAGWPE